MSSVQVYFVDEKSQSKPSLAAADSTSSSSSWLTYSKVDLLAGISLVLLAGTGLIMHIQDELEWAGLFATVVYFLYGAAVSVPVFRGFPWVGEDGVVWNTSNPNGVANILSLVSHLSVIVSFSLFVWATVDDNDMVYLVTYCLLLSASVIWLVGTRFRDYSAVPPSDAEHKMLKGAGTVSALPAIPFLVISYEVVRECFADDV